MRAQRHFVGIYSPAVGAAPLSTGERAWISIKCDSTSVVSIVHKNALCKQKVYKELPWVSWLQLSAQPASIAGSATTPWTLSERCWDFASSSVPHSALRPDLYARGTARYGAMFLRVIYCCYYYLLMLLLLLYSLSCYTIWALLVWKGSLMHFCTFTSRTAPASFNRIID